MKKILTLLVIGAAGYGAYEFLPIDAKTEAKLESKVELDKTYTANNDATQTCIQLQEFMCRNRGQR